MPQAKVLTDTDIKRILAVIEAGRYARRDRLMFQLSLLAGLRAKEIASLTIGSVINDQGDVLDELRLTGNMTKGDRSRSVPMSVKLRKEVVRYLAGRNLADLTPQLFFTQRRHEPVTSQTVIAILKRIYVAAGIVGASSHSGRRSFLTRLAGKGIHMRVLQELAGHQHLSTTQRYVEVSPDQLKQAVEVL